MPSTIASRENSTVLSRENSTVAKDRTPTVVDAPAAADRAVAPAPTPCRQRIGEMRWGDMTHNEQHPAYLANYRQLKALCDTPGHVFQLDAHAMTRSVLAHRPVEGKVVDTAAAVAVASEYVVKELACILASPVLLGVPTVEVVYHTEWPMLSEVLAGARYGLSPAEGVTFRIVNVEAGRDIAPGGTAALPAAFLCAMSIGNSYYNENNVKAQGSRLLDLVGDAPTRVVPWVPCAECTFVAVGYSPSKAARVTRQNTSRMLRWICQA